jgi:hypothetical protein
MVKLRNGSRIIYLLNHVFVSFDIDFILGFLYENVTFEMFLKLLVIYFFIIWISLLVWVMKDISNRTESILLQIVSIFIILIFTPFGIFIYLIIRPGKTLLERSYDEIEYNLDIISAFVEEHTQEKIEEKQSEKKFKKIEQDKKEKL